MSSGYHAPIMVSEILSLLQPERGGVFVDGTLGGGGHAQAVLERLPAGGQLYGIDRDGEAVAEASRRLKPFGDAFTVIRGNFFDMKSLLLQRGIPAADGILLDLGVSSHQLDAPERGFSYHSDAPLDMRMDTSAPLTAYDVVNTYPAPELARIFREYGEERFAGRIAASIVRAREGEPIRSTTQLAEIIKAATPAANRWEGQHPARRSFQAIRIEVNGELSGLRQALTDAAELLNPGGRLCVITFHSLEDRIAKQLFRELENPCTCPPKAPVCICGKKPVVRILTKKPLTAEQQELEENARSRSAKLRAIEKL
jgi:16S rRNA (cytosine1402-N4)-methyltransferase